MASVVLEVDVVSEDQEFQTALHELVMSLQGFIVLHYAVEPRVPEWFVHEMKAHHRQMHLAIRRNPNHPLRDAAVVAEGDALRAISLHVAEADLEPHLRQMGMNLSTRVKPLLQQHLS